VDISRETFKESDRDTQNLILFDTILGVYKKLDDFNSVCNQKHTLIDDKIRKSGRWNKASAAGGGIVGGFLAAIGSRIFGL